MTRVEIQKNTFSIQTTFILINTYYIPSVSEKNQAEDEKLKQSFIY